MSTIIAEIRERIARYPTARVEYDHSSITYLPANEDGFVVRLSVEAQNDWEQYTVHYNGSHQEFTHRKEAITAFAFGLSTGCRVREYSLSGRPFRWVVDAWHPWHHRWEADWEIVDWFRAVASLW